MKKTIILSIAITTLLFSACKNSSGRVESTGDTQTFNLDTSKLKKGDTFYQCEMNPEVISDKAGKCPKCDMDLVKLEKK